MNRLVKINSDSSKEITRLHGIAKVLADRIVSYRETQGYFSNPNDLAKVQGISLIFAETLSLFIDWSIPDDIEQLSDRDWTTALFLIVGVFVGVWVGMFSDSELNILRTFISQVQSFQEFDFKKIVFLWINGSIILTILFSLFASYFFVRFSLTKQLTVSHSFARKGIFYGITPMLIMVVSVGIGNIVYFQFISPHGWNELLSDFKQLMCLAIGILLFMSFGPRIFTILFPSIAYKPFLARAFDASIVIGGPIYSLYAWIFRYDLPIWGVFVFAIMGVFFTLGGIYTLRGNSFYAEALCDLLQSENVTNLNRWKAWINSRLPDPEQQRILIKALDNMYPRSKIRSIGGVILIGAGSWIILTIIGAIIQLYVNKLLQ